MLRTPTEIDSAIGFDILKLYEDAWDRLPNKPWRIRSIKGREGEIYLFLEGILEKRFQEKPLQSLEQELVAQTLLKELKPKIIEQGLNYIKHETRNYFMRSKVAIWASLLMGSVTVAVTIGSRIPQAVPFGMVGAAMGLMVASYTGLLDRIFYGRIKRTIYNSLRHQDLNPIDYMKTTQ